MKKFMFPILLIVFVIAGCSGSGSPIPETIRYPSWFVMGSYVDETEAIKFHFSDEAFSVDGLQEDSPIYGISISAERLEIIDDVPGNFTGFTLRCEEDDFTYDFVIYKEQNSNKTVEIEFWITQNGVSQKFTFGWCDLVK